MRNSGKNNPAELEKLRKRIKELELQLESHHATEKALQHSVQREKQYLDLAGVAFVALDHAGDINLLNKKCLEILGYSREELIGKNWFTTCLPQRYRGVVFAVFEKLMQGEIEPIEYYENPVLRKDGQERIIAWHNTVLRNPAGDIIGTLTSGEDITERKQQEEALQRTQQELEQRVKERTSELVRTNEQLLAKIEEQEKSELELSENEEKYRNLIFTITDPIILVAPETRQVVEVNKACENLYGYTREEFLALKLDDISEEQEKTESSVRQTIEGKLKHIPIRYHRKKDGTVFPVEISASTYMQKGRMLICGVVRDITERIQAKQKLQESEKRHLDLLENMPGVCFFFDHEGNFLSWNKAAERVYGYTKEEAIGASSYDLIVTPQTKEATMQVIKGVFEGKSFEGAIWQDRDKSGRIGWRVGNAFPLFDPDGKVAFGVNMNVDITKLKQTEEALRSERDYSTELIHKSPAVICGISPEGKTTFLNRAGELITGYAAKEIIGRDWWTTFYPGNEYEQ
ncbi:PAS domain S-box protein, partial [Candidatus Riflebacteria bacterium]